jgi:hypothetical protein
LIEVVSKLPSLEADLSAVTLAAVLGIPVGGSMTVGPKTQLKSNMFMDGELVWAAQWRRLDVKYMEKPDLEKNSNNNGGGGGVGGVTRGTLPTAIRLLPDIVSKSSLRGDDIGFALVSIEAELPDEIGDPDVMYDKEDNDDDDDDDDEEKKFWTAYDDSLKLLQELYDNNDDNED